MSEPIGIGEAAEVAESGTAVEVEPGTAVPAADLAASVEALLFVTDAPVDVARLAAAVGHPIPAVLEVLANLTAELDARQAGIQLCAVGSGFRLYTRERYAGVVEAFLLDGQRARLSQAALETLAVIAYRQPVTRARISAIRGVNVDGVIRTLLARGLIGEVGTDPDTGGALYRSTDHFLERMGLTSLEQLPSLAPLLPDVGTVDVADADL